MTKRLMCAAVVATLLGPLFAATPPAAHLRGDALSVTLPAELLAHKEVRKQLNSGLTTSFAVVATLDEERTSGARIDIRFEPWDEVYLVTTRRVGVAPQTQRLASFAHLQTWWREASLVLFTQAGGTKEVQISIDVLPFSIAEQQETQRWLTRSLGDARQPVPAEGARPADSAGVLDLLLGTSIKRRPIVRHRWQVRVTP